jgi:hypothetical protein
MRLHGQLLHKHVSMLHLRHYRDLLTPETSCPATNHGMFAMPTGVRRSRGPSHTTSGGRTAAKGGAGTSAGAAATSGDAVRRCKWHTGSRAISARLLSSCGAQQALQYGQGKAHQWWATLLYPLLICICRPQPSLSISQWENAAPNCAFFAGRCPVGRPVNATAKCGAPPLPACTIDNCCASMLPAHGQSNHSGQPLNQFSKVHRNFSEGHSFAPVQFLTHAPHHVQSP